VLHVIDTGMKPTVPLERVGAHTLRFADPDKWDGAGPTTNKSTAATQTSSSAAPTIPVYLQLHREDEIGDEYSFKVPAVHIENGKKIVDEQKCKLRWNFKRIHWPGQIKPPSIWWRLLGMIAPLDPAPVGST